MPINSSKKYRVAVLRYQHETCTFCPGGDAGIEDWTRIRPVLEGEEVLEAGSYIRGFVVAWGDELPPDHNFT